MEDQDPASLPGGGHAAGGFLKVIGRAAATGIMTSRGSSSRPTTGQQESLNYLPPLRLEGLVSVSSFDIFCIHNGAGNIGWSKTRELLHDAPVFTPVGAAAPSQAEKTRKTSEWQPEASVYVQADACRTKAHRPMTCCLRTGCLARRQQYTNKYANLCITILVGSDHLCQGFH